MNNEIGTNGDCMKCAHYFMCACVESRQDLMNHLIKLDVNVKPFKIILECPDYLKIEKG